MQFGESTHNNTFGGESPEITSGNLDEQIYDVKAGDWVMLYADWITPGRKDFFLIAKWYRVVAVDDGPRQVGANFLRELQLQGADWALGALRGDTHMAIIRRVSGVFEKTIEISR